MDSGAPRLHIGAVSRCRCLTNSESLERSSPRKTTHHRTHPHPARRRHKRGHSSGHSQCCVQQQQGQGAIEPHIHTKAATAFRTHNGNRYQ